MNLFALAGLLLAITCLIVAIIVSIYGRSSLHRIWLYCNLSICVWGIGSIFVGMSDNQATALISWKIAHLGGLSIAVFFYHMACLFSEVNRKKLIYFAYIQLIIFQILNIFTDSFIS